jgi:hypothetical protein
VETIRHWRNNRRNLRLEGFEKTTSEGTQTFSINGVSWFEPTPNGHHKEENPLEGTVIYKSQAPPGKNGHKGNGCKPINISGEIKIPAPAS